MRRVILNKIDNQVWQVAVTELEKQGYNIEIDWTIKRIWIRKKVWQKFLRLIPWSYLERVCSMKSDKNELDVLELHVFLSRQFDEATKIADLLGHLPVMKLRVKVIKHFD